ncbi:hypothetical protein GOP47_0000887 [Adiantum capillus-veneris]|uniref:Jacalin-type lectin domain-containing protein n=1 Tax=Adiantum capillus-veneris TaxID=13818 RepID=A0A9D4VED5_ADICA|nr:hypothetical protein GOP47_0000887 [Adiantum capillus-veneris]
MSIFHTPVHVIGGQGGGAFSYNAGTSGRILRRIGVWAGEWYLGGIRAWWTGLDNPVTFGTPNQGSYKEFTFEDGERITSLSLWGNGAGTRSGGIRFFTSNGREFFHYMTSWGLKQEYPIIIASGLCVGLIGRHGHHIDSLGFMFLRTIASARMINVSYPTLGLETAGIVPVTLDAMTDTNNAGTISKNWVFRGGREVSMSSTWSITAGIELHASVTVTAGIPTVAEVQGTYGWNLSTSSTFSTTHTESRTLQWEQSGVLQPGQWISIQALTRRGTISLRYEATMQITLQGGGVFSYPISNMYAGVDYTDVQIVNQGTRQASVSRELIPKEPISLPATNAGRQAQSNGVHIINSHYSNGLPHHEQDQRPVMLVEPHYKNIPPAHHVEGNITEQPDGVVEESTLVF